MSEGQRPGGLTALAVINFVFSGYYLLSLLGLAVFLLVIGKLPTDHMNETQRQQMEALQNMGPGIFIVSFVFILVSTVLLLVSGIGYLQQKKVMGRMVGSAYALVDISHSVLSAFMFRSFPGAGFNIMVIVGLIYPMLTLILVNTTFKDDLTN